MTFANAERTGGVALPGRAKLIQDVSVRSRRIVFAIILAAMLLVSCSPATSVPSPAPSPISATAAIAVAIAELGEGPDVKVVSTRLSMYGAEANGALVPASTQVWVIVLSGFFQAPSCGPMTATPHPCPSPLTSAEILVDAESAAFIQGTMPAPSAS